MLESLSIQQYFSEYGIFPSVQNSVFEAIAKFPDVIQQQIASAAIFACWAHEGQEEREPGEVYANHPLRTAARLVLEFDEVDSEEFVAALLHDTVEDQFRKLCHTGEPSFENAKARLARQFGRRVGELVSGVTNEEHIAEIDDKDIRYGAYITHTMMECNADEGVARIKLSDFLDNGGMNAPINKENLHRFKKYWPLYDYFARRLEMGEILHDPSIRQVAAKKIRDRQNEIRTFLIDHAILAA